MAKNKIASGVVHDLPADLKVALVSDESVLVSWQDLTPLARNEWICWVEDAKKPDTRRRRIDRVRTDLKQGKRRPCCWPGCAHREKEVGNSPDHSQKQPLSVHSKRPAV